ncbi:MAG: Glu-tRNA(Gln) amidotransferase subunit GatD, partial [Conexivisphaera sp.]
PGLSDLARLDTELLFNILSENMTPDHWSAIAERVGRAVYDGYRGIIITHGTDTMHYTAAALSFSLEGLPVPVVLVGAQRSSDRPSSDASSNLKGAVLAASRGDFSGVYVAMHRNLSDREIAVHLGVRVRKNHTSRRDAFQSVNSKLAAVVDLASMEVRRLMDLPPRGDPGSLRVRPRFDRRAFLLKYFPGMGGDVVDAIVDAGYRAIILEGTGLGHVGRGIHESIRRAVERGVFVGMTSQCIWGSVRMTVYDTGRDLLRIGVVPLGDMLPEVALVKAMWLLGQGAGPEDMRALMPSNMRGEVSERRQIDYGE